MSITPTVRYPYVYGNRGNDEHYEHNDFIAEFADSTERPWVQAPIVCRFFLNGNCRYGNFCRNSHVIAPEESELPESNVQAEHDVTNNNEHDGSNYTESNEVTRNWIDAPEFIPRYQTTNNTNQTSNDDDGQGASSQTISYAQIVSGNSYDSIGSGSDVYATDPQTNQPIEYAEATICPYIQSTITRADGTISCKYGDRCPYQHGELCEICGLYCLHPTDQNQRKQHEKECMSIMEKDMEHSFAVARSKDKTCGICFEVITEKASRSEHRFGILPNCNHIFCLPCIRKWRQAKNFDSTITRACPECRVESHYVCPSLYWVDTKEEKEKLLTEYKEALQQQHCKYFNRGDGTCPFGNKCFYKHALPNGELIDVGIPQQRRRFDIHGESNIVERVILWNFLQARDTFSDDDDDTISSFTDPSDLD